MFSSDDKSTETIGQLISDLKDYITLQKEYGKLEVMEKLSTIISTLLMLFVVVALGVMVLFYLLTSLVHVLAPYVGGMHISYAIIAFITLILMGIVYFFREVFFVRPIIAFLSKLIFNPKSRK